MNVLVDGKKILAATRVIVDSYLPGCPDGCASSASNDNASPSVPEAIDDSHASFRLYIIWLCSCTAVCAKYNAAVSTLLIFDRDEQTLTICQLDHLVMCFKDIYDFISN